MRKWGVCLGFVCLFFVWPGKVFSSVDSKYPPRVGFGWAWPGGKWDMLGWEWENQAKWEREYKPRILADIDELLGYMEAEGFVSRRRGITQLINIPAFILSEDRLRWVVRRFFEVARERDVPIVIKNLGHVWWDWEGCPACAGLDKERDLEWWGWSSDYIWSPDFPSENPGTWRDWGEPFKVGIPHPNFDSEWFRSLAGEKMGILAEEVASEYEFLKKSGKGYLLTGLVLENEAGYGFNFSTKIPVVSQYGVNTYRGRRCPGDVRDCLPDKEVYKGGVYRYLTDEAYLEKLSEEFFRPDDFAEILVEASGDYLEFLAKIAYDLGLPREKIISQGLFHGPVQKGGAVEDVDFTASAVNVYSLPGYSFYGGEIVSERTLGILRGLKKKGVEEYCAVEYFDWGDIGVWREKFRQLAEEGTDLPILVYLNIQNWEGVLEGYQKADPYLLAGGELVKEYVRNWQEGCVVLGQGANMGDFMHWLGMYREQTEKGSTKEGGGDFNCDGKLDLGDFMFWLDIFKRGL